MDEFFVAVERRANPSLLGKCVLVAGDPGGRGVVSSASYEARAMGCRSAMPTRQALQLCPGAVVVPPGTNDYGEISRRVFEIFEHFTPAIEPLSIDEAFLDMTGTEHIHGDGELAARAIKREIQEELGLVASVGVAPSKFIAKIASDLEKPDGLVVVREDEVQSFLAPLEIKRLWGAGPVTQDRLAKIGVLTFADLRRVDPTTLKLAVGNATDHFFKLAWGQDPRPVERKGKTKSISHEETFADDVSDFEELTAALLDQAQRVSRRLRAKEWIAKTVTLKVRTADFSTHTRSKTLVDGTDHIQVLYETARSLLETWRTTHRDPLRLLGLAAGNLAPQKGQQLSLFGQEVDEKQTRIETAMDSLADRFGEGTVQRGKS